MKLSSAYLTRVRQVVAGLLFVSALTFLYVKTQVVNTQEHGHIVDSLRQLKQTDAELNLDIYNLRFGLLNYYDPVVAKSKELTATLAHIEKRLQNVFPKRPGNLARSVAAYKETLIKKQEMLEQFKASNAVLTNSIRFFPRACADLESHLQNHSNGKLSSALDALQHTVLLYHLNGNPEVKPHAFKEVRQLFGLYSSFPVAAREDLDLVLAHACAILREREQVETLVAGLMALPSSSRCDRMFQEHEVLYEEALYQTNTYRLYLYLLCIALALYTVWTLVKLHGNRQELHRANETLEQRVTERTQSLTKVNVELVESEQRFRSAIGAMQEGFILQDAQGVIQIVNRAAEEILGVRKDQLTGLPFKDKPWQILCEDGSPWPDEQRPMMVSLREGIPQNSIVMGIERPDGKQNWICGNSAPLFRAGETQPYAVVGTFADITEQRQAERELQETNQQLEKAAHEVERQNRELAAARDTALAATQAKSEFLANMSHEIRTPMNGVLGMTELLLDTDLSDEQRDFAETIHRSGDNLLTIINDILDFSKIEAGKLELENIQYPLRKTVEEAVELQADRADKKGLELLLFMSDDIPEIVTGDPGRLRQILTNLISNAIKFTETGEILVEVQKEPSRTRTERDMVLHFAIRDTGIGIPNDAKKRLFQSFSQVDSSTTRKFGGTGLGLAISQQLSQMMGGQIGVESELGKGSTFWFTARVGIPAANEISPLVDSGYIRASDDPCLLGVSSFAEALNGKRVLIVDDNATNRRILFHQTSQWGMLPYVAEDARMALMVLRSAAARKMPYDVVILDFMMPEMDGFGLTEIIKSDPLIDDIPLVMLTSYAQRGHRKKANGVGIAVYLAKPVRQAQLHAALLEALYPPMPEQITLPEPLPVAVLSEPSLLSNPSSNGASSTIAVALPKGYILIAEDNTVNQKVALRQVEKLGYQADVVVNGREALEALSRTHYDAILMDCQMPEMDGFAATAAIRAQEKESNGPRLPVIALTANALAGEDAICLAAGMDDYISKPFKTETLQSVLAKWITTASN